MAEGEELNTQTCRRNCEILQSKVLIMMSKTNCLTSTRSKTKSMGRIDQFAERTEVEVEQRA